MRPACTLLSMALLAGCAWGPEADFPPGVAGYECGLRQETPGGAVSASAWPDYRGGYRSRTLQWESIRTMGGVPFAKAAWTDGPKAIAPPGWLEVSHTLDELPPIHTKIRLQLRSGEFMEQDFVEPKDWERRKRGEDRFRQGGIVFVRDMAFIEKFTQAGWAEVSVIDPAGNDLARVRYDLTEARESFAVLRRMGEQMVADVADYPHRCTPYKDAPIEEII